MYRIIIVRLIFFENFGCTYYILARERFIFYLRKGNAIIIIFFFSVSGIVNNTRAILSSLLFEDLRSLYVRSVFYSFRSSTPHFKSSVLVVVLKLNFSGRGVWRYSLRSVCRYTENKLSSSQNPITNNF